MADSELQEAKQYLDTWLSGLADERYRVQSVAAELAAEAEARRDLEEKAASVRCYRRHREWLQ